MNEKGSRLRFATFAQRNPERLALIDPQGKVWTRGELAASVNRISRALIEHGCEPGSRIAVISPNCPEFVALYLAATQVGLYLIPINWHLTGAEIAHILWDSSARVVFLHADVLEAITATAGDAFDGLLVVSIGESAGVVSLERFQSSHSGEPLTSVIQGTVLLYTSATTGLPKAVAVSLADAEKVLDTNLSMIEVAAEKMGAPIDSGQAYLCPSMLYHGGPLSSVSHSLHLGNPVVLMKSWGALRLLEAIEKYQVRATFMVPSMFVSLLKLPAHERARFRVDSLRCVSHGAAPCPTEIKRQMIEWFGPILVEVYGATEGGGTIVTSEEWLRFPGTVGRPFPGGDVRILDDERVEVAPMTVGNVYLKSFTGTPFEYVGDTQKTRNAYYGEYFTVGDLGYVNEEGYLFICDRKVDRIVSGGTSVYSLEVERVLILHPAVRDCAVVGVPDAVLGQAVVAVVEVQAGHAAGADLQVELSSFLAERLSMAQAPREFRWVDRMPRDPAGKLFKRRLREQFVAG